MSDSLKHRLSSRARRLLWRGYEELLQPNRLEQYRALLEAAIGNRYTVISTRDWAQRVSTLPNASDGRLLIMRHDIDTDADASLLWHAIEAELGCRASYYFRLCTWKDDVVSLLVSEGAHVSYHFEELAEVAKQERVQRPQQIRECMPGIQARFAENLARLRKRSGLPMEIVCSHGDWMNRRLGIKNYELLRDQHFRASVGIEFETYDAALMDPLIGYFSDDGPPAYWRGGNPLAAIRAGMSPIGILTHPKHWRGHLASNLGELGRRTMEGASYRFGR